VSARVLLPVAVVAIGCGGDVDPPAAAPSAVTCAVPKQARSVVIARFSFVRANPMRATESDGFDLDGVATTGGSPTGCGRADFTAPDGRRGVDNQLAQLIPAVDAMTGGALDGAIQGAVNNGQLLVALTFEGLDSRCDDPDVTVVLRRVGGTPFVGSDMLIDPGQTFDVMRDQPATRARGRVRGGVLSIDPTDIPLPIAVFGVRFVLTLYRAQLQLRFTEGGAEGVIGGGINVDAFTREVNTFEIPNALRSLVGTTLRLTADLAPGSDGRCQQVSAAMSLMTRHVFVNP
jgi:hypothetical protein